MGRWMVFMRGSDSRLFYRGIMALDIVDAALIGEAIASREECELVGIAPHFFRDKEE